MKIFNTIQIKEIDSYTIEHEPISSIQLIERVADTLLNTIINLIQKSNSIAIIAGKGNNGSDALALAQRLKSNGFDTTVFAFNSEQCKTETKYFLQQINVNPIDAFIQIKPLQFDFIIDGLLGTGLSKPIEGIEKTIIEQINKSQSNVISIDIPSGLQCDSVPKNNLLIVKANHTLTLEFPKLSFLFPENSSYVGDLSIIPICLHKSIINKTQTPYYLTQKEDISLKKRDRFSNKGTYGHVLTISGSYGKMGACILTSTASLKIGAGLVTAHIPECGNTILQTAVPEVMASIDKQQKFVSTIPLPTNKQSNVISIGPGLGTEPETQKAIVTLLRECKIPIVIDADALNCIVLQKAKRLIPINAIITPHIKEFERLFGNFTDSLSRLNVQIENSIKHQIYIVLKGYRTSITTPEGEVYFNSTGNPGMATAGSGDVLTGIIAGLLSQGYSSKDAAIYGVYIHGLAGDIAAEQKTEYCMMARDIITFIPQAMKLLIMNQ
jgi:NAD(P)H-hydrate epimerase